MRTILILFVGMIFSGGCAPSVDSNDSGDLEVIDYGIYGPDRNKPELLSQTDEVAAVLGTVFGVRVQLVDSSSSTYSYRWSFPQMRNPADGQVWTEMTGTQQLKRDGVHPFLVKINNDWEAVSGDWTIQLFDGERLVLKKTFRVHASPPDYD
jgi:hypothetical protein